MSSFVIADETRTGSAGPIRENAESIIVRAMDEPAPNAKPSLRVWPKDGADAVDAVDTGAAAAAGAIEELEKPFFFSKMVGVVG